MTLKVHNLMKEKYIRKQDVMKALDGKIIVTGRENADAVLQYMKDITNKIKSLEPADVVQVVRCDDCVYYGSRRWCELHSSVFDDNAFCSYGERREE